MNGIKTNTANKINAQRNKWRLGCKVQRTITEVVFISIMLLVYTYITKHCKYGGDWLNILDAQS